MTDVFVGDLLSERPQTGALRFSEGAERLPGLQGLPLFAQKPLLGWGALGVWHRFRLDSGLGLPEQGCVFWRYVEASRKLGGLTHDVLNNDFIEEWRETGLGDGNV